MDKDLTTFAQTASGFKKQHKQVFEKLWNRKRSEVDAIFHQAHDEVFACTDCMKCANCCKTTGPLFTSADITRIASKLKLSEKEFISKYLRKDEDDDLVLKSMPCVFLDTDNSCKIYEFRPKACREYPHTDRVNQQQIFYLTKKNISVCPAVFDILENIRKKIG